jgi:hypothetical protein
MRETGDWAINPCSREVGIPGPGQHQTYWAYSELRLNDGNWERSGIASVLLLISSVDPCTMFRFFAGVTLAAAAVTLAWAAQSQSQPPSAVAERAALVPHTTAGEMPVNANWFDLIFESARRHSESESERPRRRDDRPEGGTYRTLCVRLCDGFYFPISYSTRRGRFAGDAKQCEQSCPAGSRLFVHRNPGQDGKRPVRAALCGGRQ